MREDELVRSILDALIRTGWLACHFRPARTGTGWRTAVQGNIGFPDIIAIHPRKGILALECKSDRGRLTAEQIAWKEAFEAIEDRWHGGLEYRVVRPDDWMSGLLDDLLKG